MLEIDECVRRWVRLMVLSASIVTLMSCGGSRSDATATSAVSCGEAKVDGSGLCKGDTLQRCGAHDKVVEVACSAIGRSCGALPSGYATCLALDQPASKAEVSNDFMSAGWSVPVAASGYSRASLDISPQVAVPEDGTDQNLLFGSSFVNGPAVNGVYGGLVAVIRNSTSRSGERGLFFSVIGGIRAVYPVAPAEAEVDGTSAQLTVPLAWTSGRTYRMVYELVGDDPRIRDAQLIRASVLDVGSGQETRMGDIAIPKAWRIQSGFFTAVETYPLPTQNDSECRSFAASDVRFTRLRAGSEQATYTDVQQLSSAYNGPCRGGFFAFQRVDDGYRMKLGVR